MVYGPPEAQPHDHTFDYELNPTWRIFRIMSEFAEGFTFLARVQRSVTFIEALQARANAGVAICSVGDIDV